MAEFHLKFIALPLIDTDIFRLFTHSYSLYMGLGRWHFLFHSPFRSVALKKRWAPVTTAETIFYKRSIKAFSRVTLATKLVCWNEKRFYLSQTFWVKGQIQAETILEGLIRGPAGILGPIDVFRTLGVTDDSPPMPHNIQTWLASLNTRSRPV